MNKNEVMSNYVDIILRWMTISYIMLNVYTKMVSFIYNNLNKTDENQ